MTNFSLSKRQIISLLILLALVLILPLALFLSRQRQEVRKKAAGTGALQLTLNPDTTTAEKHPGDSITYAVKLANTTTSAVQIRVVGVEFAVTPNLNDLEVSQFNCSSALNGKAFGDISTGKVRLVCYKTPGSAPNLPLEIPGNTTIDVGSFRVTLKPSATGSYKISSKESDGGRNNIPQATDPYTDLSNIGAEATITVAGAPTTPVTTNTPIATPTRNPTSSPTAAPGATATVTFQQGTNGYSGVTDTCDYIYSADNCCPTDNLQVGYNQQFSALFKYDLSSIPSDATIANAKFQVYARGWGGENISLGVYKVLENWGCAIASSVSMDTTPLATITTNGIQQWYEFILPTSVVQNWIANPANNFGISLNQTVKAGSFYFHSSEITDISLRPKLTVTYRNPVASPTPTTPAESCPNGELGNLDCDPLGLIYIPDLSLLLDSWASDGPVPTPIEENYHSADICCPIGSHDNVVNIGDLSVLLDNWKSE